MTDKGNRGHRHQWAGSVNSRCPNCDGRMELCERGDCRLYRCTKCRQRFTQGLDRWQQCIVFKELCP